MAMIEKHVEPDADAARQLMDNKYRDMRSASGRNLRDFIIVRDYINLLEYTKQVLHHFQHGGSSSWTTTGLYKDSDGRKGLVFWNGIQIHPLLSQKLL
jgi:hypothetical protein